MILKKCLTYTQLCIFNLINEVADGELSLRVTTYCLLVYS